MWTVISPPVCLASVALTTVVFCYFSLVLKFVFLKWQPEFQTTCNLEMFYVLKCTLLSGKAFMCQVAKQECYHNNFFKPRHLFSVRQIYGSKYRICSTDGLQVEWFMFINSSVQSPNNHGLNRSMYFNSIKNCRQFLCYF